MTTPTIGNINSSTSEGNYNSTQSQWNTQPPPKPAISIWPSFGAGDSAATGFCG